MGYPGHRLVGGAIRLFAPGPLLGVAEGIETALAVHVRTGMPVWSAVSANLLERLEPPAKTSLVVIWADRDRSGTGAAAALLLRERSLGPGILVAVHLPPGPIPPGAKGVDWVDVWSIRPPAPPSAGCREATPDRQCPRRRWFPSRSTCARRPMTSGGPTSRSSPEISR
jgi:hypothetical protein